MTAAEVRRWADALDARFAAEADALGALDARAGDGDHGAAMARGFAALSQAARAYEGNDVGELLLAMGRAFLDATGGASGPLVGSLFLELGKHGRGRDALSGAAWADGLADADALVRRMGRAEPGDKTLLDALAPAAEAAGARRDAAPADAVAAAARAAAEGRDGTTHLRARRGRAHWVEGAGAGHADPGATSVALILALADETAAEGSPA